EREREFLSLVLEPEVVLLDLGMLALEPGMLPLDLKRLPLDPTCSSPGPAKIASHQCECNDFTSWHLVNEGPVIGKKKIQAFLPDLGRHSPDPVIGYNNIRKLGCHQAFR
ncbi:hypothetical protein, partial [Virgibacillus natechei]|uniref:hypothetical protein n=1 Tax=Virgibacillus natechei TaxID=1216297 RepID=UPI001AE993FB